MRGFGDTERVPIDATRGLGDWADDVAALLDALGSSAPPHLVGWSTGGAAIAAFALERPVASLTFIDPVVALRLRRRASSTARRTSRTSPARAAVPATRTSPRGSRRATVDRRRLAPRNVPTVLLARRASRAARARGPAVAEVLKSVTGDDGYPGDVAPSENWPGVAPGTRGILNALSPKYCDWAGIVDLDPKPPSCGHTARRTSSSPTARRGSWGRSVRWAWCRAGRARTPSRRSRW